MIRFTDEARSKAMEMIVEQGDDGNCGFRIGVKKNGCQVNYHMDLEKKKLSGDAVIIQDKLILYADFDSLPLLSNVVIDYINQDEQEGFIIRHPFSSCSGCQAPVSRCH